MSGPDERSSIVINWTRQRAGVEALARVRQLAEVTGLRRLVKSIYQAIEDPWLRPVLEKNAVLHDIHRGARCFILGSAPSLREIEFAALADEYVFGCNFLFHHADIGLLRHLYYAEIEPLWLFPAIGLDAARYYGAIDAACQNPDTVFFFRAGNRRFFERRGLFAGRPVHWVATGGGMQESTDLVCDLTRRIAFMDGVVFFTVAAALYMGFREIYLCGAGYTYTPMQEGHFYSDRYLPPTDRPVDSRHERLLAFARSHDAAILNVVPQGFGSPVYPATTWAAVRSMLTPTGSAVPRA